MISLNEPNMEYYSMEYKKGYERFLCEEEVINPRAGIISLFNLIQCEDDISNIMDVLTKAENLKTVWYPCAGYDIFPCRLLEEGHINLSNEENVQRVYLYNDRPCYDKNSISVEYLIGVFESYGADVKKIWLADNSAKEYILQGLLIDLEIKDKHIPIIYIYMGMIDFLFELILRFQIDVEYLFYKNAPTSILPMMYNCLDVIKPKYIIANRDYANNKNYYCFKWVKNPQLLETELLDGFADEYYFGELGANNPELFKLEDIILYFLNNVVMKELGEDAFTEDTDEEYETYDNTWDELYYVNPEIDWDNIYPGGGVEVPFIEGALDGRIEGKVKVYYKNVGEDFDFDPMEYKFEYSPQTKSFSLKEFVDLCNNCSEDLTETEDGRDTAAKNLGIALIGGDFADKDDKIFCECLKKRKDCKEEYVFLQDNSIVAKVNPYDSKTDIGKLSQKWHALISMLAYYDTASFDEYAKGMEKKFQIGKIERIEFDKILSIRGEKGSKIIKSKDLCIWIKVVLDQQKNYYQ